MAGFPTRPSRAAFGPKPQNRFAVRDPVKYGSADLFDLVFWQCAGMGVCAPVALAVMTSDGTNLSLFASGEAWDPDGGSLPTIGKIGAGQYQLVYNASYLDKDGNTVTTNLLGVVPVMNTLNTPNNARLGAKVANDRRTIDIRHRNSADTLVDVASGDVVVLVVF